MQPPFPNPEPEDQHVPTNTELAQLLTKGVTGFFRDHLGCRILGLHCTSKNLRASSFPQPGIPGVSSSQLAEKRLPLAPLGPPVFSGDSLQPSSGCLNSSPVLLILVLWLCQHLCCVHHDMCEPHARREPSE